ncbi:hypothetical protein HYX02_03755 [Candidatus Woesearchaeota archaeon]|nr:hypothetical protein [Candidatus Woesearchaeota archaeon]
MKKDKLITSFFVFVLLINIASAITTYEETSSVSRIVGESPTEMLRQMQRNEIDLQHATYFGHNLILNEKISILNEQFKANKHVETGWMRRELDNKIPGFSTNELFLLETTGEPDTLYAKSKTLTFFDEKITPTHLQQWQLSFETNNPLMLWDSPYAGSYLPKEDTFVSRLVRDTTIIAPTSFNSPEFTKSFLCQLVNDKTIGQVFKEARNFHYNGGSKTSGDNLIGLVLQSYALYGNPRQVIKMDWNDADLEKIKKYCENFLENLAPDIDFLEQVGNYSKFRKHVVFEIPSYTIESNGNYSIINAENTFQNLEFGELVLPMAVRTTHFPLNTLITNFSVDYIGDYVDLTVNDLPSYEQELANRTCYTDNESHSIQFENSYTENSQDFIARITPVEIINCTEGRFRLYKKFNYSVDYIALSPVLIKSIVAPIVEPVNSIVNISIELLPLTSNVSNGSLAIFDENNNKLWEQETTTNITNYNASFLAPNKESLSTYSVEFIVNNETLNFDKFSLFSILLDVSADIPVHANSTQAINLNFYSYSADSFELRGKYYLTKGTQIIAEGNITKTISQGANQHQLVLSNLLREEQSYTLTFELNYLEQSKTLSYILSTNNVPILFADISKSYTENDTVAINYTAFDYDNDALNITINDSRFVNQDNAFFWKTNKGDEGNYSVKLTASDGLTQDTKTLSFSISKPPVLTFMKIESLSTIYTQGYYKIFEFVIFNDGFVTITDVQWQFDTGDANIISNNQNITSLSPGERTFVIVEYNYTNNGVYNVTAKASGMGQEPVTAQLSSSVNIGGLIIKRFDAISIIGTNAVFEVEAQNMLNEPIGSIRWTLATGDGSIINSTNSFMLASNETITLLLEYNYTSGSVYNPVFEITNGTYSNSKSMLINTTSPGILPTPVPANRTFPDVSKFLVKDSSGNSIAWFGDAGNIVIKGVLEQNSNYQEQPNDLFAMAKDGNVFFVIAQNGSMYIDGTLTEKFEGTLTSSNGVNNLGIYGSDGNLVGLVNTSGHIFLKETLTQNGNP